MSAQYWMCPDCGALLTPFHSHCHNCGRRVGAAAKFLMLASLGYIAASSALKYTHPLHAEIDCSNAKQVPTYNSTGHTVKDNLYLAELVPCGHYAWVKAEDPSRLVGINVFCPDCPPDNNFRQVANSSPDFGLQGEGIAKGSPGPRNSQGDASTMPITIYLSDETIHPQVETAIEALLDEAGLQIESRDDPILGSWFRRMVATVKQAMGSPAGREATLIAAHIADTRLVLIQDATVTASLLQNLGPVLGALQPTKDAVIRAGALLIVKDDWVVKVFQLTAAQQALLDHRPQLSRSPHEVIAALNLMPGTRPDEGPHCSDNGPFLQP